MHAVHGGKSQTALHYSLSTSLLSAILKFHLTSSCACSSALANLLVLLSVVQPYIYIQPCAELSCSDRVSVSGRRRLQAGNQWGRRRRRRGRRRRRPTRRAPETAGPCRWWPAALPLVLVATATRPSRRGRRFLTSSMRELRRRRRAALLQLPPNWRIRCTAQGSTWLAKRR